jgi:hypothetical protein
VSLQASTFQQRRTRRIHSTTPPPPVVVSGVLILCAVLESITHGVAGIAILTALGLGAATTGTVFGTAKNTKTDQAAVIWGSAPVSDVVTPPLSFSDPVVEDETPVATTPAPEDDAAAQLNAEVDAVRGRHASTSGDVS